MTGTRGADPDAVGGRRRAGVSAPSTLLVGLDVTRVGDLVADVE
jgi:hypothetical protein